MNAVISDFEQRVREIDGYLKVLKQLEDPNVVLLFRSKKTQRERPVDEPSFKVMKATVFLLVYNMIESAIGTTIAFIYEQVKHEGKRFEDMNQRFQAIWIRQQHRELSRENASPAAYEKQAEAMIRSILSKSVVELDPEEIGVSGNLDARLVRQLCEKHGIDVRAHPKALGGAEMLTVKTQRNALAHGDKSFSDCGKDYGVDDLIRIKRQAEVFTRSILRNAQKFALTKQYSA